MQNLLMTLLATMLACLLAVEAYKLSKLELVCGHGYHDWYIGKQHRSFSRLIEAKCTQQMGYPALSRTRLAGTL